MKAKNRTNFFDYASFKKETIKRPNARLLFVILFLVFASCNESKEDIVCLWSKAYQQELIDKQLNSGSDFFEISEFIVDSIDVFSSRQFTAALIKRKEIDLCLEKDTLQMFELYNYGKEQYDSLLRKTDELSNEIIMLKKKSPTLSKKDTMGYCVSISYSLIKNGRIDLPRTKKGHFYDSEFRLNKEWTTLFSYRKVPVVCSHLL